jgi:hypothetical protein
MRFFAESSVLLVSDHCTPTPMVSVSTTTASRARRSPTPAEQPTAGRIVGQAQVIDRFMDDSARSTPSQAYSGVGCDLTARTCNSDVGTWPRCHGVPDEVLADNRCTVDGASALVLSVPSIFVGDIGGHAF